MRAVLLVIAIVAMPPAWGMKVAVEGDTLFATGDVAGEDFVRFKEALQAPGLRRVALINSHGGDLWAGLQVGRLIADAGLDTVAAGYCVSSCSVMYMGGKERRFAQNFPLRRSYIGVHGAHSTFLKSVVREISQPIDAWFRQRAGDSLDVALIRQALFDIQDASGLLRLYDPARASGRSGVTYFCPSGGTPRKHCKEFPDRNAVSAGIVTSAEPVRLAIPNGFLEPASFFGLPLEELDQQAAAARVIAFGERRCATRTTSNCADFYTRLATRIEESATDFGLAQEGADGTIFFGSGQSPLDAALRALYACNNNKDGGRICRVVMANGTDLSSAYADIAAASMRARAAMKSAGPGGADEAPENRVHASSPRVAKGRAEAPASVEGAESLTTAALLNLVLSDKAPLLIDVGGVGPRMLPDARALTYAGNAYEDAEVDGAYQARFVSILKKMSADPSTPLVFYADGTGTWAAANAALRARAAGHTRVMWYRPGLAGWQAAGLPTVQKLPVAVMN